MHPVLLTKQVSKQVTSYSAPVISSMLTLMVMVRLMAVRVQPKIMET